MNNLGIDRETNASAAVKPLTDFFRDPEGRLIRLWSTVRHGLIGSVLGRDGSFKIIPGENIRNPLNVKESPQSLLSRLEQVGIRNWDFVYNETHSISLTIWPHLEAAGKEGQAPNSDQPPPKLERVVGNEVKELCSHFQQGDHTEMFKHPDLPIYGKTEQQCLQMAALVRSLSTKGELGATVHTRMNQHLQQDKILLLGMPGKAVNAGDGVAGGLFCHAEGVIVNGKSYDRVLVMPLDTDPTSQQLAFNEEAAHFFIESLKPDRSNACPLEGLPKHLQEEFANTFNEANKAFHTNPHQRDTPQWREHQTIYKELFYDAAGAHPSKQAAEAAAKALKFELHEPGFLDKHFPPLKKSLNTVLFEARNLPHRISGAPPQSHGAASRPASSPAPRPATDRTPPPPKTAASPSPAQPKGRTAPPPPAQQFVRNKDGTCTFKEGNKAQQFDVRTPKTDKQGKPFWGQNINKMDEKQVQSYLTRRNFQPTKDPNIWMCRTYPRMVYVDREKKELYLFRNPRDSEERQKKQFEARIEASKAQLRQRGRAADRQRRMNEREIKEMVQAKKIVLADRAKHYKAQALKISYGKPNGEGGKGTPTPKPGAHQKLGQKGFEQVVQQTNLVKSYRATHPHNPVPSKPTGHGDIGGVACSTVYMKGLFDTPESLFETQHCFYLPTETSELPFSNGELQQLIRELAIGIYVHSAVPFFSLHFNQSAELFPVIHPCYKNTLVGRVIGMLDYIMKGYLNGGIFQEDFIDQWAKNPVWSNDRTSIFQKMIDFQVYCAENLQGDDRLYFSARELETGSETNSFIQCLLKLDIFSIAEQAILIEYSEFSNSFRIIASQNKYQKTGNLFSIDSDFKVEYTIAPTPQYQQHLEHHIRRHGVQPPSYLKLCKIFETLSERIHDHLVKFPLCKQYFSMLHVISFLTSYFSTLKQHRKIPTLDPVQRANDKGCPTLFPNIPLRAFRDIKLPYRPLEIISSLSASERAVVGKDLLSPPDSQTVALLQDAIHRNMMKNSSPSVAHWLKPRKIAAAESVAKLYTQLNKCFVSFIYKKLISDPIMEVLIECKKTFSSSWRIKFKNYVTSFNNALKTIGRLESERKYEELFTKLQELMSENFYSTDPIFQKLPLIRTNLEKIRSGSVNDVITPEFKSQFFTDDIVTLYFNGKNEDLDKQAQMLVQPAEETPGEILRSKRMVGGCGLDIKTDKVESTPQSQHLYNQLFVPMLTMQPETWHTMSQETASSENGAFFSLEIESMPPWSSDYSWMEHQLFIEGGARNEDLWTEVSEIITEGDQARFDALDLSKYMTLKDSEGKSLLHVACAQRNPYFTTKLLAANFSDRETDNKGFLPIHYAAMESSGAQLPLLLKPATVNAKANDGTTPLIVAAQFGTHVELLLKNGASQATLTTGYTPLHCALHQGHIDKARAVLKSSLTSHASLNLLAEEGGTPLMLACQLNDLALVQEMVAKGADPAILSKKGLSAIQIALKMQNGPLLEYLLTKTAPSNTAIEVACKESTPAMVAILAKHPRFYSYLDPFNNTPLMLATLHGNLSTARFLLQSPQVVALLQVLNDKGETVLDIAIHSGFRDFVFELVAKGASNVTVAQLTSLVRWGYHERLKELLAATPLTPEELQTVTMAAAESGNFLALSLILCPMGARLEAIRKPNGWDIAHFLAKFDAIFLFREVMTTRPDKICRDSQGKSLAVIAAEHRSLRVLRELLQLPVEVREKLQILKGAILSVHLDGVKLVRELTQCPFNEPLDDEGTQPVHLAAQLGSRKLLKFFDAYGVDFDCRDHAGKTPLFYALRAHAVKAVQFLLNKKVSITKEDLLLAATQENLNLLSLLLQNIPDDTLRKSALAMALEQDHRQVALTLVRTQDELKWITDSPYHPANEVLRAALNDKDSEKALECLKQLPLNEKVTINRKGELLCGTPLLLALHFNLNIELAEIEALISKGLDPNLADSAGNTLAHLLARRNLSPKGIVNLNCDIANHRGQKPLHVAAGEAVEAILREFLLKAPHHLETVDLLGQTPLFYAAHKSQYANLQFLLEKGADSNRRAYTLVSPLVVCVNRQDIAAVNLLCDYGADVNQVVTTASLYPLHFALKPGNVEVARTLIYRGAKGDGTVVQTACDTTNLELLRLFHGQGINLQTPRKDGTQAIHRAAAKGAIEVVQELVAAGVPVDSGADVSKTPLFVAAVYGETETFTYLLEKNAQLFTDSTSVLEAAGNSPAILSLLKEYDISKDTKELQKAAVAAIERDNPQTLQMLLEGGLSLNGSILGNYSPIHIASMAGAQQCTQFLLENGADVMLLGHENELAIELAAANKSPEQFLLLLDWVLGEESFDINYTNRSGESLFHLAVKAGNRAHLIHLFMNGFSMDMQNAQGHTPFKVASQKKDLDVMKLLIACGASTEGVALPLEIDQAVQKTNPEETPLHLAIRLGERYSILLFMQEEDVNAPDSKGITPLHLATERGYLQTMRDLVVHGAAVNVLDHQERSPLSIACLERHDRMQTELLMGLGADPRAQALVSKLKEQVNCPDQTELLKILSRT